MTMTWNYRMSKKMIMKNAHRIAKATNQSIGCYAIAYKVALKYVLESVNKYEKRSFGDMAFDNAVAKIEQGTSLFGHQNEYYAGIPEWILRKNLDGFDYDAVTGHFNRAETVRETAKAVDFKIVTDFGDVYVWVPKSVINNNVEEVNPVNNIFDGFAA